MVAAPTNHSPRKSGDADSDSSSSPPVAVAPEDPSSKALAEISNNSSDPASAAAIGDASSASSLYYTSEGSDSNVGKKTAWKKPSNGGVDGSVMGGQVWPALSATAARATPKSAASDSLKETLSLSDGSASRSQENVIPSSQQQQEITNNTNPSFNPHPGTYTRQKSMKRGVGNSSGAATANCGFTPLPSSILVGQMTNNSVRPGLVGSNSSPRETGQRGGFGTQSHHENDHRNTFRRDNGSPRPRGDGSFQHNYRARSERDRGNHYWNSRNSPRNFNNSGDAHMQPQRGVARGVMRPLPHVLTPYMPHPMHIPMGHPEVPPSMMYAQAPVLQNVSNLSPLTPRFMVLPPHLHAKIMAQIHYYFSDSNLCKDTYLRENMDEEGWVAIELIAGFKLVRELIDNVQIILDVLSNSTEVEVQGDKIRKRNDWKKWIMPPSVQFSTVSSPRSLGNPIYDPPLPNIHGLSIGYTTERRGIADAFLGRSLSGNLSSSSQLLGRSLSGNLRSSFQHSTGEGTSQDNEKKNNEKSSS